MTRHRTLPRILAACFLSAVILGSAACSGGGAATTSGGGPDTPEGGGTSHALVGKPAPTFTAEKVQGEGPATLEEAKGKVVIVDFWATYCDPCKKSFPKYQELVDQFGGELAVIAVSVDEKADASKEGIMEFAKATNVKFAIVWDTEQKVAEAYNPPKMPTSFIIDKAGVVRHVHGGYEAGEEAKIAEEIKALLQ